MRKRTMKALLASLTPDERDYLRELLAGYDEADLPPVERYTVQLTPEHIEEVRRLLAKSPAR